MPYAKLNDRLLGAEGILANLKEIRRDLGDLQKKTPELDIGVISLKKLRATRGVLRSIFFDVMSEEQIQKLLLFHFPQLFPDYPLLGEALSIVFLNTPSNSDDLNSMITTLEEAIGSGAKTDWCPTEARLGAKYDALNTLHCYFPARLEEGSAMGGLFKKLVVACRKVCVLIEKNNTPDDGMAYDYAYKLMALLIDVGHKPPSFESLSKDIDKLLTSLESKEQRFHQCLLDLRLPRADALHDKAGWVSFVKTFNSRALRFFSSAIKIEEMSDDNKAPLTLEEAVEALAKARYEGHSVDTDWTQLCSRYNVPESTFKAGLDYITPGWPKKGTDSIPELKVDIEHEGYIWTKLSASDKRGLILGKITNCCQSIGDHSSQCVDDAMSLGTNALYVLLKRTGKAHAAHKKTDGSINDDDYQIIGQSYVWKSKNGNLCLDSVECLAGRVRPAVTPEGQEEQQKVNGLADLRGILHRFGQEVLALDTSIKRVTLGTGGNTPRGLFDEVMIPEAISQGHFYGDAERQYLIARKSPLTEAEELDLSALCALCASCVREPGEFYECMRYLSEQMGDTRDFTKGLSTLIQTYPGFPDLFTIEALHRLLHFTSAPTFNDLVPIDFKSLESMREGGIWSRAHLMWQANTPEKIIKALPCIPPEDRLVAVMEDRDGRTVLHHSTENAESLAVIFKLLSKDDAMAALRDQDRRDQTSNRHPILRHAARYPKSLQLLLGFYSEDEALAAMMQSDPEGNTVLHDVAEHPDSLEVVLSIYPEEQRLAALSKKNGRYMTVLQIAINNPASLKVILSHLPDVARLAVLHEVLYHSLKDPESLKCLLNHYTEDQVLAAMEQVVARDTTVLHQVAEYPDSLKIVLSLYPEEQRLAALSKKNGKDETVLRQAVKNPESLRLILSHFPEEQRLAALNNEGRYSGHSVLPYAAPYPQSLELLLSLHRKEDRLAAVLETDQYDDTAWHAAAAHPESLRVILAGLPESVWSSLMVINRSRQTVLHIAARYPESLEVILLYLPESERLTELIKTDEYGKTVFDYAATYPESLRVILKHLPATALTQKDPNNNTLLHHTARYPASIGLILSHLPEQMRLACLMEKNGQGNTPLDYATGHFGALDVILSHLNDKMVFSVLLFATRNYSTDLLRYILNDWSNDKCLHELTKSGPHGNTVLHHATPYPQSFKLLLSYMHRDSRLSAVSKKNSGGFDVLSLSALHLAERDPQSFYDILALFPAAIAHVLCTRRDELSTTGNEVLECASSIEAFMKAMEGLAKNESIEDFVCAIITNKGIEAAQKSLLKMGSSPTFFKPNEAILSHIQQLHPYWLTRVQSSEPKSSPP